MKENRITGYQRDRREHRFPGAHSASVQSWPVRGFGGGVTALRLTEAGVSTVLMERGMCWPAGPNGDAFARFASMDGRSAWLSEPNLIGNVERSWAPFAGVLEVVKGEGMTATCGAALGVAP